MCNGSGRFLAKNGWSVFKTEQGVRYRTPSEEGLLLDINCLSFWHGCCFRKSAMIDKNMDREISKEVRRRVRNKRLIRYGGIGVGCVVVWILLFHGCAAV